MNMKQVWGAAGGFFFVFILITLTNKPKVTPKDERPTQPEASVVAGQPSADPAQAVGGDRLRGFTMIPPDGSHYVSAGADTAYREIAQAGGNWVALAPLMTQLKADTPALPAPSEAQLEDLRGAVKSAKAANLKVFLRPLVGADDGTRSDGLAPPDAAAWMKSYRAAIEAWASLAEAEGVELLAVGSKLGKLQEDAGWADVVTSVRRKYKGQLTYAAAPDAATGYGQIAFWRELDYVGIDGYFPLTDAVGPQAKDLEAGWTRAAEGLEGWQGAGGAGKPILLTSAGVPRLVGAAAAPGVPDRSKPDDAKLQAAAEEAFFKTMWTKTWLAGVFWHTWSGFGDRQNPYAHDGFPALEIVKSNFATN